MSGVGRNAAGDAGDTDPYSWFTDFNKNDFPPHTGAGAWGVQSVIDEPVAPTITSTGTASNTTQLEDALQTGGVRVTLTADISGFAGNFDITDSEIVVPTGTRLLSPIFGGGSGTVTRLLIRGDTLGTYGGGQIHNLWLFGTGTDFVVDGLSSSGAVDFSCMALGPAAGFDRVAITNCRLNSGGFGIGSTCGNIVVAGCSILTGNDLAFPSENDEAYGIRAYFESNGNVIVAHCDIRSNPNRATSSHARFRCHPDAGLEYVALLKNRFVERVEHWIGWVDAAAGGGSGDALAVFVDGNEVISSGTGTDVGADTPKLYGSDTAHAYIRNNVFKSDGFTSDSNIALSGSSSTTKSGNSYESLPGSDPAWSAAISGTSVAPGAGDPSGIDWTP